MFRRSGRSYGNATWTAYCKINDPDHWDNLNRLDRSEFYPDDRDDRVSFETIERSPRDHHFYSSNQGEIVWPRDTTEAERKIQKCLYREWAISQKEIVSSIKFLA